MDFRTGYKFETVSVIPDTWDATSREKIEGRIHEVVNNKAQYCSVVRTGFGKVKLVIGGEVDASKEFPLLFLSLCLLCHLSLGLQTRSQRRPSQLGRAEDNFRAVQRQGEAQI